MKRGEFLRLGAALPWAVRAAATGAAPLEELLASIVRDGAAPGAGLAAVRGGGVRFEHHAGTYCSPTDRQARLTAATRHPLYSFSKLITATVAGVAQQEGRIGFDDRVARHIPEFQGGGKDAITLRHCLTHSAGLSQPASTRVHEPDGWERALRNLCAAEAEWPAGSRSAYHAWTGAFLVAECIRRAYGGRGWPELCRDKLFEPLGAATLSFARPRPGEPVAQVPQPDPAKPPTKDAQTAFSYAGQPGAGCFGTLADALKVLQLHLQGGVWESRRVIAPEVLREIHTVQFAAEIARARAAGRKPDHEPWGLGPLLRGDGPAVAGHRWFGFANQSSPGVFGHAGIDTLIGVADPASRIAFVFATTDSPKPAGSAAKLRVRVTDQVFAALA